MFKLKTLNRAIYKAHVALWRIEILGATLASNFESADFWLVMVYLRWENHSLREVHHEHLREASSEASTIDVHLARLWQVYFLASRTEVFEPAGLELVTEADRQDFLAVTESSWTRSIHSIQVLLVHFGEAASC